MMVLIHVLIAVSSLLFTVITFLKPSKTRLRIVQTLIVSTLASGTYLVINTHSNMVSVCFSGLMYLGFVSTLLMFADYKLVIQNTKKQITISLLNIAAQ
jgi:hypothetical protein